MNHREVQSIIESVCEARGVTIDVILSNDRTQQTCSARRAIAMIIWDKFGMTGQHNSQMTWIDIAEMLNCARSSLHSSARRWAETEGAQDGKEEERLRQKGRLLPKGQESIHEMAQRVCKRRLSAMPKGRRKELGYWFKEGVNHG